MDARTRIRTCIMIEKLNNHPELTERIITRTGFIKKGDHQNDYSRNNLHRHRGATPLEGQEFLTRTISNRY